MKLIFLDIDGVVNTPRYANFLCDNGLGDYYRKHEPFDPISVLELNRLIEYSGAKIVISSTWRLSRNLEQLQNLCSKEGIVGEVVGKTPNIAFNQRGNEIQAYLNDNPCDSFVAIDDDDYDMKPVSNNFVHIDLGKDEMGGFDHKHFWKALEILG